MHDFIITNHHDWQFIEYRIIDNMHVFEKDIFDKFSVEKHIAEHFKEDDTKFWRPLDFSIVAKDVKCWNCGMAFHIIKSKGSTYSQFSYQCLICHENLIACCKCGHTFTDYGNKILKGMAECKCHYLPFCMYCIRRDDTECTEIPDLEEAEEKDGQASV